MCVCVNVRPVCAYSYSLLNCFEIFVSIRGVVVAHSSIIPPPTTSGGGILLSVRPSFVRPLTPISRTRYLWT